MLAAMAMIDDFAQRGSPSTGEKFTLDDLHQAFFWWFRRPIKLARFGCETELCGGVAWFAYRRQDSSWVAGGTRLCAGCALTLRLDRDIAQRPDSHHPAFRIADREPAELTIAHELLRDLEIIFGGAMTDRTSHCVLHSHPMKRLPLSIGSHADVTVGDDADELVGRIDHGHAAAIALPMMLAAIFSESF